VVEIASNAGNGGLDGAWFVKVCEGLALLFRLLELVKTLAVEEPWGWVRWGWRLWGWRR